MTSRARLGIGLSAAAMAGVVAGFLASPHLHLDLGGAAHAAPSPGGAPPSFVQLAKTASPAVVNINVKIARASDIGYDPFGGGPQYGEGLGTGFFISADGYILTNDHVVGEASAIQVTLADGRELRGKVIGSDPRTDIALIKVDDKKPFPFVRLGDSEKAEIGEWVVAIGNPFGLDHTVTAGIISAKGRRNIHPSGRRGIFDFIQTDASINPGNSGGPLLNLGGEVIGINAAVNAQGQGIGFAIPINMAKTLLPMLKDKGKVQRSYLGVYMQDLTRDLARSMKLPEQSGALVTKIAGGSPAAKAGISPGDVIVSFDGKPVKDANDLSWLASTSGAGRTVTLGVAGSRGARQVKVTLADAPEEGGGRALGRLGGGGGGGGGAAGTPGAGGRLGVAVEKVTPELAQELGLDEPIGVVITRVSPQSPAAGMIARGDVIVSIADQPIRDAAELDRLAGKVPSGDTLRMLVVRQGMPMWLAFTVP